MFGPGYGTAIGAGIGGLAGLFGSKKKKKKNISTFDKQQQGLYNQYVQGLNGQGQFGDLYNYDSEGANANFDKNVSRPAYRNFQENIVPTITGQFRQGNLQNSSYAGQALSRAGRDVQEGLDAQRSNMQFMGQQNAKQNKQGALQNVLGMQTFARQDAPTSSLDQTLSSLAPSAGKWFSNWLDKRTNDVGTTAPTAAPIT
jgi:hypothetical protein